MKTLDAGTYTVYPYGSTIPPVHAALFGVSSEAAGESSAGVLVSSQGVGLSEPNLFYDDFETGDLSKTNDDGFRWSSHINIAVNDNHPLGGSYSVEFDYDPSAGADAELNFNLGEPQHELWIRWFVYIPANYEHLTSGTTNRKFLALWGSEYSGPVGTPFGVTIEYYRTDDDTSFATWHYPAGSHKDGFPSFISKVDHGTWMECVVHVKLASSSEAEDGIYQFWIKREGASEYTQVHNRTDMDGEQFYPTPGDPTDGIRRGYFLGAVNSEFSGPTYYYIDNVGFSTEPWGDLIALAEQ